MVDRIQGNNFREEVFSKEDFNTQPRRFPLAEILARISQDRFHLQLDEVLGEIAKSDARLTDIAERIKQLVTLQQKGNEEIARALKEMESDPVYLEWELHLHRFGHVERIANLDSKKLALEVVKWMSRLPAPTPSVPVEMPAAPSTPRQEPILPVHAAVPSMRLATVAAPVITCQTQSRDEHRYTKIDTELNQFKQSLEKLKASVRVIQDELKGEAKSSPLIKRLFALLAALFGRIFSPGLNMGRQIEEVRLKKHRASGA